MTRTLVAGLALSSLLVGCSAPRMGARYIVMMEDASGLGAAAPVYVSGVRIGTVQTVRLDNGKARIEFDVETASGVMLREDACATAGWYSGAVTPHLRLELGTETARALANGGEIKCVKSGSPAMAEAEKTLVAVRKVLETALEGKGTLGRLLKDEDLAQRVSDYFAKTPPPREAEAPVPAPKVPGTAPPPGAPAKKSTSGDLLDPFGRH